MRSHPADSDPRPSRRFGLSLFLLLLTFIPDGVSGNSGAVPGEGTTGVVVEGNVPFARESLGEIRALAPYRVLSHDANRAIPFRRNPRHSGTTLQANGPFPANASGTRFSSAPVGTSAPVLDNSFAGLGNPPRSAGDVIPPDTMGAAGPNHLVSLLNSEFGVFDKATGAILDKETLQAFWASLGTGPGQPANFPFDTKVLFDQHSGRFVAVTLGGRSAPDSWVMVAVSSTANPLDTWYKWAIDADRDNLAQLFNNSADFPGLGLDAFNVYISANMFSNTGIYQYSKVWAIPKPQLLAGTNPITWTEFRAPPGSSFSMQPAHTFGAAAAEYFVFEGPVANHLLLAKIDNVSGTPVWHAPVSVAVTPYTTSTALPGAPQDNNSNAIDTADTRMLSNAVYRNGYLWATHHVAVSGKVEVAWYRMDPVAGTVASQGRINDPSRWYYYPSIAVNQDNVAAIGFSGSSPTEYAGAYYTVIRPPYVAADPVSLLKAGEAPYYKTLTGTENRWGDFSATSVDPTDDLTFWTLQEYAWTPDPSDGRSRWGTWWGSFRASVTTPPGVVSPGNLTATIAGNIAVQLTWTDLSTGETGYVVVRKEGASGTYGLLTSPPLPANSIGYTDTAGLSAGQTYYYLVGAVGPSGTAYSAEVSVTTPSSSGGGGGGGCLTLAGPSRGGDPVAEAFAIAILLSPIAAIGARKRILQRRVRHPLRHPSC